MSLTKGSQADYQGTQNRLQRLKHFCMIDFICKVLFLEAWCKVSKRKKESDLTKIWTILLRKRNRFLLDRTTSSCNYLYSSTRKSKQYFVWWIYICDVLDMFVVRKNENIRLTSEHPEVSPLMNTFYNSWWGFKKSVKTKFLITFSFKFSIISFESMIENIFCNFFKALQLEVASVEEDSEAFKKGIVVLLQTTYSQTTISYIN